MEYFGIDVAKWQGNIDWAKVKASGKTFAILKITNQNNAVESSFERNYAGATSVGMNIGVYRYVYATTIAQAQAEAKAIVKVLQGKSINYGVWLDMEDKSIKGLGKTMLTKIINAETKILNDAGYEVGIYCNLDWYNNLLDTNYLKKYFPFWIARYGMNNGGYDSSSSIAPKDIAKCWQYTSKGNVDGIGAYVDLDVAYCDLAELFKTVTNSSETNTQTKTVYFAGARQSETNGINGAKGDSTGKEISIVKAYTHKLGWRIFRHPDQETAYWIGTNGKSIANNNNFGYGQSDRTSGYIASKKAGYEPKNVKVKCNLDCSEMVRTCVACALEKDIADFNTATEPKVLLNLGFKEITGASLSSLQLGDIVCTPSKGHTEIVCEVK